MMTGSSISRPARRPTTSAGDVLAFNVNSASTVTRLTMRLKCTKT